MDFADWAEQVVTFCQHYPLLAVAIVLLLLVLAYQQPKTMGKLLLFLAFVAAVFYLLSYLGAGTTTGIQVKERAVHRTEKALE